MRSHSLSETCEQEWHGRCVLAIFIESQSTKVSKSQNESAASLEQSEKVSKCALLSTVVNQQKTAVSSLASGQQKSAMSQHQRVSKVSNAVARVFVNLQCQSCFCSKCQASNFSGWSCGHHQEKLAVRCPTCQGACEWCHEETSHVHQPGTQHRSL
jgi:hypothetical protein